MSAISLMTVEIDESARISDSRVGRSEVREYVTIHESEIGDGCRVYERCSLKRCAVADDVDINAGTYVENADVGTNVQIGPNCSVVGVTHGLSERGMEFRNDAFDRVRLNERVFIGATAVVTPGIEIGEGSVVAAGAIVTQDIDPGKIVFGTPPTQRTVDLDEWVTR